MFARVPRENVEFRQSTRNVWKFGGKWGTECLTIRFLSSAYPVIWGIKHEVRKKILSLDIFLLPINGSGCDEVVNSNSVIFKYAYINLYFYFFALVSRLSTALSSATQHAMPPKFGRKWGTECVNTRVPSAYPAVCGIQREAGIYIIIYLFIFYVYIVYFYTYICLYVLYTYTHTHSFTHHLCLILIIPKV